ncbi:MAG: hypothetical protein ACM3ZE_11015 [Myxococcales bacterium]
MASNSLHGNHRILGARSARRLAVVGTIALAWVTSCSLRNLDELGPGDSAAGGQTSNGGGSGLGGFTTGGGNNLSGGSIGTGGGTPSLGGGGSAQGGVTAAGGINATGGTTGKQLCPVYTSTGGTLVTPPSNDFENEAVEWSTTTEQAFIVSTPVDPDNACLGTRYLSCDGTSRKNANDGPGIDIVKYVNPNHLYTFNLAVRFSPKEALTSSGYIKITVAKACQEATVQIQYVPLTSKTVGTTWTRIVLPTPFSPALANCNTLKKLFIYAETESTDASRTIEIDDFQLWDVTPSGAGGAGGTGSAGAAAAAGSGTPGPAGSR